MQNIKDPVLVTGGEGFIGSHLVKKLLEYNKEVHVIDKEKGPNLYDVEEDRILHQIDMKNFSKLEQTIEKIKPKQVFHLAASLNRKRSLESITEVTNTNIIGTINLIHALEKTNYNILISAGTCEEYGQNKVPFNENQSENPVSPYSWSKASISLFSKMLNDTGNNKMVILRPSVVYGPNQKNNLLIPNIIISALFGREPKLVSGKQTRDFIYISDMIDAYIKAAETENAKGKIINIGGGREYSVRDVVTKILELMGNPIKANFGTIPDPDKEIYHYYADINLAKDVLEWKPKVDLEDGLRRTIDWYTEKFEKNELGKWLIQR